MVEIRSLCASYGGAAVLEDINFTLTPGTITGLLGANGSGKSTLLKAICGMVPHEGQCLLYGTDLSGLHEKKLARKIAYMPQRSAISMDLTAQEVVEMGFNPQLPLLAAPTQSMRLAARRQLEELGIEPEKNYLHLSEGQKQLCMLARVMVSDGELVLLDEPESALDLPNRYESFARLKAWMGNKMILAALHDPQLALRVCDRLIVLKDKTVDAVVYPGVDSEEVLEQALSRIYGSIRLRYLEGQWVMIKR